MDLLVDHRWSGPHGIGRFSAEVLRRLPAARPLPSRRSPLHPLNAFHVASILRKLRPGVYFTPGFNPPRNSPVPFVFCLHDLIHLRCREESSAFKRLYYQQIVRPAGFRAARVLTVSQYSRDAILNWSGWPAERVAVVGNGVGSAFHPDGPAFSPGYPYLLHVGQHKPHRNVDRLLEALAQASVGRDIKLLFVARPTTAEHRRVTRLGLGARIVYVGDVDDAQLAALYRGAAALLLPSLHEGFGLPAVEAMACGTPVACSKATCLPEIVGDAALCFDATSVDAIASAIERLVADAGLRQRLRASGFLRCTSYSWDATAQRIHEVLAQAVH